MVLSTRAASRSAFPRSPAPEMLWIASELTTTSPVSRRGRARRVAAVERHERYSWGSPLLPNDLDVPLGPVHADKGPIRNRLGRSIDPDHRRNAVLTGDDSAVSHEPPDFGHEARRKRELNPKSASSCRWSGPKKGFARCGKDGRTGRRSSLGKIGVLPAQDPG